MSNLIFERWRVKDRCPGRPDESWAGHRLSSRLRCLKFWSLEAVLGAAGQAAVSATQEGRESGAKVKRFTGCQEKSGGWIGRGSFSLSTYESQKSWNYLKSFTYSYISFIFHLFPLFCSYSPVLLSFESRPALISCFLVLCSLFGIFLLLSVCYVLQAFHISEMLQVVLLSLSLKIWSMWSHGTKPAGKLSLKKNHQNLRN